MSVRQNKNWLEWAVFALGLTLVAGALGYLIYGGATMKETTPVIEISIGEPERHEHYFGVPVGVLNTGDRTAEGVKIEVVLEGGGEPESGEFTIAFVPRKAKREGWVAFKRDPREGKLTARVAGYAKP